MIDDARNTRKDSCFIQVIFLKHIYVLIIPNLKFHTLGKDENRDMYRIRVKEVKRTKEI